MGPWESWVGAQAASACRPPVKSPTDDGIQCPQINFLKISNGIACVAPALREKVKKELQSRRRKTASVAVPASWDLTTHHSTRWWHRSCSNRYYSIIRSCHPVPRHRPNNKSLKTTYGVFAEHKSPFASRPALRAERDPYNLIRYARRHTSQALYEIHIYT